MNGKDLFTGLGNISPKYYEEAENGSFTHKTFRRPLLIAAIVALSLLLTGCAVAYVLHMQDMKVGELEASKPVFATDGIHIDGYEDVTEYVLTMGGLEGTPGYLAAQEWFDFKQEYDPDHTLIVTLMQEGKVPEFPEEYDAYNLYSQEMKDALDEILAKYNLKPQGPWLNFRTVSNLCTALGIEKILPASDDVTARITQGSCREQGNFQLSMNFDFPESVDSDVKNTWGVLYWNRNDCFSDETITIEDTGDWQEWNYTTASGNDVLILRSPSHWQGWIISQRPEGILSLMIEARVDLGNNVDGKTWWDHLYMTDRQMEQVADAIDFGIQPKVPTQEDVDNQAGIPEDATQDGYTVVLKSVETDGVLAYITLGITAPEGTVINRSTIEGFEKDPYTIGFGNLEKLTPAVGDTLGGSIHISPREDGDGLDNTQDFVLEATFTMEDGTVPFAPGSVWNLRLEDLIHSYWDGQGVVDETLAEGEWLFEITIEGSSEDFREIQLITEPVTAQAVTGYTLEGDDVYEDVVIKSFILRSRSAVVVTDNTTITNFGNNHANPNYAVMKDGSRVQLLNSGSSQGTSELKCETPIDVTQVDQVILGDGTVIPVPEADPRELELIQSPVKTEVYLGMDAVDGHDVYGEIEIKSFVLRSDSATMDIGDGNFIDMSVNPNTWVVMKDGSKIKLVCYAGKGGAGSQISWQTEADVDLDQADHVLLPDGTQLPVSTVE